jgi:hypothetical protein
MQLLQASALMPECYCSSSLWIILLCAAVSEHIKANALARFYVRLRLGYSSTALGFSITFYLSLTALVLLFDIATVITKGLLWTPKNRFNFRRTNSTPGCWRQFAGWTVSYLEERAICMAHPFSLALIVLAGLMTYYLCQAGSVPEPLTGVFCGEAAHMGTPALLKIKIIRQFDKDGTK